MDVIKFVKDKKNLKELNILFSVIFCFNYALDILKEYLNVYEETGKILVHSEVDPSSCIKFSGEELILPNEFYYYIFLLFSN